MKSKTTIFLLVLVGTSSLIHGQDASELVRLADQSLSSGTFYSRAEIRIYQNGQERPTQEIETYAMEKGDENLSLTVYSAPRRMAGTANLMIGDELWVRFASTGRVRKLSSSARENSAGGSDFSYADMGEGSHGIAQDYQATLDGEETIEGNQCYKIILTPLPGQDSSYEKLVVYVDQQMSIYRQVDYWQDGAVIKSLSLEDYRNVGDSQYPFLVTMESRVQDSRTVVETLEFQEDSSKVQERLFTTGYLNSLR